jgi:hypothetical protein
MDASGELYVVSYSLGRILRLIPTPLPAPSGLKIVTP